MCIIWDAGMSSIIDLQRASARRQRRSDGKRNRQRLAVHARRLRGANAELISSAYYLSQF
jgi:hypothetical protein